MAPNRGHHAKKKAAASKIITLKLAEEMVGFKLQMGVTLFPLLIYTISISAFITIVSAEARRRRYQIQRWRTRRTELRKSSANRLEIKIRIGRSAE